jgi:hypothetical protein
MSGPLLAKDFSNCSNSMLFQKKNISRGFGSVVSLSSAWDALVQGVKIAPIKDTTPWVKNELLSCCLRPLYHPATRDAIRMEINWFPYETYYLWKGVYPILFTVDSSGSISSLGISREISARDVFTSSDSPIEIFCAIRNELVHRMQEALEEVEELFTTAGV